MQRPSKVSSLAQHHWATWSFDCPHIVAQLFTFEERGSYPRPYKSFKQKVNLIHHSLYLISFKDHSLYYYNHTRQRVYLCFKIKSNPNLVINSCPCNITLQPIKPKTNIYIPGNTNKSNCTDFFVNVLFLRPALKKSFVTAPIPKTSMNPHTITLTFRRTFRLLKIISETWKLRFSLCLGEIEYQVQNLTSYRRLSKKTYEFPFKKNITKHCGLQ